MVVCLHVCDPCVQFPQRPKEVSRSPGTKVADVCESPCDAGKPSGRAACVLNHRLICSVPYSGLFTPTAAPSLRVRNPCSALTSLLGVYSRGWGCRESHQLPKSGPHVGLPHWQAGELCSMASCFTHINCNFRGPAITFRGSDLSRGLSRSWTIGGYFKAS